MSKDIVGFDRLWNEMADEGKCDGYGGSEYTRIVEEWLQVEVVNLADFIRVRANICPQWDDAWDAAVAEGFVAPIGSPQYIKLALMWSKYDRPKPEIVGFIRENAGVK